jgi:hypothetical protein
MVFPRHMTLCQSHNGSGQAQAGKSRVSDHLRRSEVRWLAAGPDRSQLDFAMVAPAPALLVSMLLAELVELGREAWWISERERTVRAQIKALQDIEGNE